MKITYKGARESDGTISLWREFNDDFGIAVQLINPTYSHIADGYDWGNAGPGARNLADRLLGIVLGSSDLVGLVREDFLNEIIAGLPSDEFKLTQEEILHWLTGWLIRHDIDASLDRMMHRTSLYIKR